MKFSILLIKIRINVIGRLHLILQKFEKKVNTCLLNIFDDLSMRNQTEQNLTV